jgi:hypothetical protein
LQSDSFPWRALKRLPNNEGVRETRKHGSIVITTSAENAPMVLESLEVMDDRLSNRDIGLVLVVEEPVHLRSDRVALFVGKRPASAESYLVSADGKVVFETVGLPNYGLIRSLLGASE